MRTLFYCSLALLFTGSAFAQAKRASADDAAQKELYAYVLTMDKVQKLAGATKSLNELTKAHPEMKNSGDDAKTLDQTVAKLQKYPEVMAALNKNGLSPREYAVGIMTLIQASMAVGFKKTGTYKEYPPDMLKLVNKANLDFVDTHYDQIKTMTEGMMQAQ